MICNTTCCLFIVIAIIVVSLAHRQSNNQNQHLSTMSASCRMPNRVSGQCIPLVQCQHLINLKNTGKHADIQYVLTSQCGAPGRRVYVCCPLQTVRTGQIESQISKKTDGQTLPVPGVCGGKLTNRIVGGIETEIGDHPWAILIEYKRGNLERRHRCGGSLINERYILTAAHCLVTVKNWTPSRVRLGEWDTTTNPDCATDVHGHRNCAPPYIDIDIERIIPHEKYAIRSRTQLDDIGLIRLARSVIYTDYVQPICLPTATHLRERFIDGEVMEVVGWGKTEKSTASNRKLKADVPVVLLRDCQRVYNSIKRNLQNSQLCAGGEAGIDSCNGDSGGPLLALDTANRSNVYMFLSGVVSFGPSPCGLRGWPGVYTKVSSYIDWIKTNLKP